MMNYAMLIVLMLGNVQAIAPPKDAEVAEVHAAVHQAVRKLHANVKQAKKTQKLPSFMETASSERRLVSASDIDFTALCGSACWGLIKTWMIKYADEFFANCIQEPAEPCDLEEEKRRQEAEAKMDFCMFDMCSMSMGPLGTLTDVCSNPKGINELLGPTSIYKMDSCVLTSFSFYCDNICHTDCQTNNAAEKTLFCAPKDPNEPVECPDTDPAASSAEIEDMFNLICLKNENGEYCQALGGEWEKKGAFAGDPTEVFPDPCDIDCSGPTGQALKAMGCCWGSFMNMAEGNPAIMPEKELRVVKAATFKCAGMKGMKICNSGGMVPTEIISGKLGLGACPSTTLEVRSLKAQIGQGLAVPSKRVSLVACTAGGNSECEGGSRRMASTSASLNYAVKVTGKDEQALAAKKASVSTSMKEKEAETIGDTTGADAVSMASRDSVSLLLGMFMMSHYFH